MYLTDDQSKFLACIFCIIAQTPEHNAVQRTETLLNHMEDYYSQTNDAEIRPNKFSYNTVLTAWTRNT